MRSRLIVALLGLILAASPALARERCRVSDPTGTPLNIRDLDMHIVGTIENGRIVFVDRFGKDAHGKPWAYILADNGDALGWVYREFISCF